MVEAGWSFCDHPAASHSHPRIEKENTMAGTGSRDEYGNLSGFGLRVPTSHPCPPWCVNEEGHGYDAEVADGYPSRWHDALDEHFEVADRQLVGEGFKEVGVSVHTLESVHAASDQVVWVEEPELWLGADDMVRLTAAEARRLAAALLQGAARLEAMQA